MNQPTWKNRQRDTEAGRGTAATSNAIAKCVCRLWGVCKIKHRYDEWHTHIFSAPIPKLEACSFLTQSSTASQQPVTICICTVFMTSSWPSLTCINSAYKQVGWHTLAQVSFQQYAHTAIWQTLYPARKPSRKKELSFEDARGPAKSKLKSCLTS